MLITGANGFVGAALLQHMQLKNWNVRTATRDNYSPINIRIDAISGSTDWTQAVTGCDVVIHLAAKTHTMNNDAANPLDRYKEVNSIGTLNLATQAAAQGVSRFVFISSIKVNGELGSFSSDEVPVPLDAYGSSKLEAEQGLFQIRHETGMEIVVIRPPLVYGPGVKGNFASMVKWIQRGFPLPFGTVHNKRSLIALDNLVDFIALCADLEKSPQAANQTFLVSDGEDVSTTELLRKIGRAYGREARLLPVPVSWMRWAATLLGKEAIADRLFGSLVVDSSKARELLGWKPVITMDEQLCKMARNDQSF